MQTPAAKTIGRKGNWAALMLSVLLLVVSLHRAEAGVNAWTTNGPHSETINALAIDPQTPTTLYASSSGGSVFKSTDGGGNWSAVNTGLDTTRCCVALAIDPQTPAILYAGGTDAVFKSTDGGGSWHSTGLTKPGVVFISALAIDPQAPATLYAGTYSSGVFKSTDAGVTWGAVNTGLTSLYVRALVTSPLTPTTLYAGTTRFSYPESWTGGAVFKSTDGGESWSIVNTGLHAPVVGALAIDPKVPSTVYAGTGTAGAFKSTDGGASWSAVFTGPSNLSVGVRDLAIDPQTPNTLYASNGGDVFKSTDGASSWGWRAKARWLIGALAVDPQTPANVYAGTGDDFSAAAGGIFKSTDYLDSWSWNPSSGLTGFVKYVTALVFDPQTPTTLYAGMWTTYYGPHVGGVYKSTDGGTSWNATGLSNLRGGIGFTSGLAIDPQTPTTLYATSGSYVGSLFIGGVFKSTDGGESWRAVTDLAASPHALIGPLAIDPQTPATLYVGTRADGVFKSTDGGESWSAVSAGLPNLPVTALAIDPQTPTILYAGTERGGVFKSTDGGESWSAFNTGLTNLLVNSVVVDPQRPTTLYAGTQGGGVFVIFTPADASARLIEAIRRALPPEEQTSLIGPLRQVATLLTDANPANDRAACGRLDAFIDQVNAKEQSGEVTAAQATQLRQDAGDITAALGCP